MKATQMINTTKVGANRSPLRGIKEQDNEDHSELTYRPSNIFLTEEVVP